MDLPLETQTALLYSVGVFLLSVLVMNRGAWWMVNIPAQKEPLVVAVGAFMALSMTGVWMWVGVAVAVYGAAARYGPVPSI